MIQIRACFCCLPCTQFPILFNSIAMRTRILSIILLLLAIVSGVSQELEKDAVKKVVNDFFDAFHAQDSMAMKKFMASDVVLQTTGLSKTGRTRFKTEKAAQFYRSIATIPDSIAFQERLTSWNIQVDRTMANAWVGYEFWFNGTFSHCGVNSFQLVNFDGQWKIVYLIDTRARQGCLE